MRQLLYVSRSNVENDRAAIDSIVHEARTNNALDGVTGLLWSEGARFAQVIEGDERAVEETMARIRADRRHHSIEVLLDRTIDERQFGSWSMQLRDSRTATDGFDARMGRALENASEAVRSAFAGLVAPA